MAQPGYQEGSDRVWWWKVAQHLDEAQLALVNAMAHNLDDQTPVFALQDRIREAQSILLYIFQAKGLLPASPNGAAEAPKVPTAPVAVPIQTMDATPVPLPAPAAWAPGAWVPAAQEPPPMVEEDAAPPVQDPAPAVIDEIVTPVVTEEDAAVVVVTSAPAPAAPLSADPNPEA